MNHLDIDQLLKITREICPEEIARDICSVQPMTGIGDMSKCGEDAEVLREQGYRPVSRLGLLWVQDHESTD